MKLHPYTRRRFLARSSAMAAASMLAKPLRAFAAGAAAAPSAPVGPYQPTWDSIRANYQYPGWFRDAKFGIFLHWGLYSVPAHGSEWYLTHMYGDQATVDWHTQNYGPPDKFGYKDFIPLFKAEHWDPDAWGQLFKKAGAEYVMPTAVHHDGFALWDSAAIPWNAVTMGPKRDLVGDLAKAVRKAGLHYGVSNHYMEHFTFVKPLAGLKTDLYDPTWAPFYSVADRSPEAYARFLASWVASCKELIDQYQVETLYFDNGVNARTLDPQKLAVAAYYYNRATEWKKQVTILTKSDAYLAGSVQDSERQQRAPTTLQPNPWEVDDAVGTRWGYVSTDTYGPPTGWIMRLIENVSRNGNLLLNFGPKSDGTFADGETAIMLGIGEWLGVNGEAIYKTRPWTKFGEGDSVYGKPAYTGKDIRFTRNGDTLYAILMAWPGEQAVVASLASGLDVGGKVAKVEMLGHKGNLRFTQGPQGLAVTMPTEQPGKNAFALKISGLKLG